MRKWFEELLSIFGIQFRSRLRTPSNLSQELMKGKNDVALQPSPSHKRLESELPSNASANAVPRLEIDSKIEPIVEPEINNFVFPSYYPMHLIPQARSGVEWANVAVDEEKQKQLIAVLQKRALVHIIDLRVELATRHRFLATNIVQLVKRKLIVQEGDFFSLPQSEDQIILAKSRGKHYRSFFSTSSGVTDMAFGSISLFEWQVAILHLVKIQGSISMPDLPSKVAKAMGFGRLGRVKLGHIFRICLNLLEQNRLLLDDGRFSIVLPEAPLSSVRLSEGKPFPYNQNLYRQFVSLPVKVPFKAEEADQLPIQAAPYQLARDKIDRRIFPIYPTKGWEMYNMSTPFQTSIEGFRFDPIKKHFCLEGTRQLERNTRRIFSDFPAELPKFEVLGIYSRLTYDTRDEEFSNGGLFGLYVRSLQSREEGLMRVCFNHLDGLFYGRIREGNRLVDTNHLQIKTFADSINGVKRWVDVCLGDLTGKMITPVKIKRKILPGKSVNVAVEPALKEHVQTEALRKLHAIVQVESPIHLKVLHKRAAESLNRKRMIPALREMVNRIVLNGEKAQKFLIDGQFVFAQGVLVHEARDRSALTAAWRKFDYISDWEIRSGIDQLQSAGVELTEKNVDEILSRFFGVSQAKGWQAERLLNCLAGEGSQPKGLTLIAKSEESLKPKQKLEIGKRSGKSPERYFVSDLDQDVPWNRLPRKKVWDWDQQRGTLSSTYQSNCYFAYNRHSQTFSGTDRNGTSPLWKTVKAGEFTDFPQELVEYKVEDLYSCIFYDIETGQFKHDGTFALFAKRPRDWQQHIFRVWHNRDDGLFYGQIRFEMLAKNLPVANRKWGRRRTFESANVALGNLQESSFTPVHCSNFPVTHILSEAKVDLQVEGRAKDQHFKLVEIILRNEGRVEIEKIQQIMAEHVFGLDSVTERVKSLTKQILEYGERIGKVGRSRGRFYLKEL